PVSPTKSAGLEEGEKTTALGAFPRRSPVKASLFQQPVKSPAKPNCSSKDANIDIKGASAANRPRSSEPPTELAQDAVPPSPTPASSAQKLTFVFKCGQTPIKALSASPRKAKTVSTLRSFPVLRPGSARPTAKDDLFASKGASMLTMS